MANEFKLDLTPLERAIKRSPAAASRGAKQGLDDIKDDWVRRARDVAPIDTTNLRREINGEIEGNGLNLELIIAANATSASGGKPFNYAYYIHEKDAGGKKLKRSGTVKKFLDEPAESREKEWQKWLEEEIMDALKREGW